MKIKTMRDALIELIYQEMFENNKLYFVSADFGSPVLDKIREEFKDRFINVGIAEQNLINISTGLALEGFIVYAYAIAPFMTMRAYEQIRINLSLQSHSKELNVNLIGVGAGLSYDVSGPTHHCLEDLAIIGALPHITVFSPSDWVLAEKFMDYTLQVNKPKYMRFDGKPLPSIYDKELDFDISDGFFELERGEEICIVSTGYMTHRALEIANEILKNKINIGVIDIFLLKPLNEEVLFESIKKYKCIITLEEAFINKGGLDSLMSNILTSRDHCIKLKRLGFRDEFVFDIGSRQYLHKLNGLDSDAIVRTIEECL